MSNIDQSIFSLILPSYYRGGFPDSYFIDRLVGTSDCSEYIPAYSLFSHKLHVFENEDNSTRVEVMQYNVPTTDVSHFRQYNEFINILKGGQHPRKFLFKVAGVLHSLNVFRGILYDDSYNILMCLGIKSDYVMNTTTVTVDLQTDKFILFISDKFLEDKYKNLRKKLDAQYISLVRDAGIDIMETKKINKWLFSNNYKAPVFKSVMDMKKYLKEEVPKMMLEL